MGSSAWAATMILNDASDGESIKQGINITETGAAVVVGKTQAGGGFEYRGFVSFEITNVIGTITAAQLRLKIQSYNNGATALSLQVYDYTSGPPPTSILGGDSTGRFNDLGSGVLFGAASINSTTNPADSLLTIDLNSAALSAMNTGSGVWVVGSQRYFTVGLADPTISGPVPTTVRFMSGNGTGINQLAVTTAPEPSAGLLAGVALAGVALRRFGRECRAATHEPNKAGG